MTHILWIISIVLLIILGLSWLLAYWQAHRSR
jgi:hypothetical protein